MQPPPALSCAFPLSLMPPRPAPPLPHFPATPPGRLSQDEIERMVQEAEEFADQDKKVKERVDARNQLETYVYNIKQQVGVWFAAAAAELHGVKGAGMGSSCRRAKHVGLQPAACADVACALWRLPGVFLLSQNLNGVPPGIWECFSLKSCLITWNRMLQATDKLKDKLSAEDREAIEKAAQEALDWLDENHVGAGGAGGVRGWPWRVQGEHGAALRRAAGRSPPRPPCAAVPASWPACLPTPSFFLSFLSPTAPSFFLFPTLLPPPLAGRGGGGLPGEVEGGAGRGQPHHVQALHGERRRRGRRGGGPGRPRRAVIFFPVLDGPTGPFRCSPSVALLAGSSRDATAACSIDLALFPLAPSATFPIFPCLSFNMPSMTASARRQEKGRGGRGGTGRRYGAGAHLGGKNLSAGV